jgi:hypothetical protein
MFHSVQMYPCICMKRAHKRFGNHSRASYNADNFFKWLIYQVKCYPETVCRLRMDILSVIKVTIGTEGHFSSTRLFGGLEIQ